MNFIEGPSVHATRMVKVLGILWKLLNPLNDKGKFNNFFVFLIISHANFVIGDSSYLFFSADLTLIQLAENAGYLLQIVRHSGYLVILFLSRERIQRMMDIIVNERLQLRSTDDDWSLSIDYIKKEFLISVASAVVMILYGCVLVFTLFFVDNVNDYQLPYNFYFVYLPFDSYLTPKWFLHYIQQAIMGNSAIAIFYFYSGYALLLMNFSCWEIDALTLQVKEMFHKELDENLIQDQMKKTVLRSYRVMDWMKEARWLLRFSFLFDFSLSAFILCMCLYILSSDIFESITMFVLICVSILQLCVYCWMGNRFNICIENLTSAVYEVEWFTQNAKTQRDHLLILIMAQRLKGFNGIFYTVDLQSLLTILQFTYSLLALLRTTN